MIEQHRGDCTTQAHRRTGGHWRISQLGSASEPIQRHCSAGRDQPVTKSRFFMTGTSVASAIAKVANAAAPADIPYGPVS